MTQAEPLPYYSHCSCVGGKEELPWWLVIGSTSVKSLWLKSFENLSGTVIL